MNKNNIFKALLALVLSASVVACNDSTVTSSSVIAGPGNASSSSTVINDDSSSSTESSSSSVSSSSSEDVKEDEFKQYVLTPDVFNVAVGSDQVALFTNYEIDGVLPDISDYKTSDGEERYKLMNYTWSTPVIVDENGKILLIGFGWYKGYGGSYNGPEKVFNGLTHYPEMLNKDNPGFTVSEDWEPWPSETRNNFDFVVPSGGFALLLNGTAINKVMSMILDDENFSEKNAPDLNYTNAMLQVDYTLADDLTLSLDENNNVLINHGEMPQEEEI